jgi:tetratricopeptide (TPR) repeat protein
LSATATAVDAFDRGWNGEELDADACLELLRALWISMPPDARREAIPGPKAFAWLKTPSRPAGDRLVLGEALLHFFKGDPAYTAALAPRVARLRVHARYGSNADPADVAELGRLKTLLAIHTVAAGTDDPALLRDVAKEVGADGDLEGRRVVLTRLLDLDPSKVTLNALAGLHRDLERAEPDLGHLDIAERYALASLSLDPSGASNAAAHTVLIAVGADRGDDAQLRLARQRGRSVLADRPDDAFVLSALARVEAKLGDLDAADRLFRRADELKPGRADVGRGMRWLVRRYREIGRHEAAASLEALIEHRRSAGGRSQ